MFNLHFRRGIRATRWVLGRATFSKPSRNILLFHHGRCGSTVLGKLLDQQSGFFWDGEIFTKTPEDTQGALPKLPLLRSAAALNGIYGFEFQIQNFFQHSLDIETFFGAMFENVENLTVVSLRRKNLLRYFISILAGIKTGTWRCDGSHTNEKIRVSPEFVECSGKSLIHSFESIENFYESLEELAERNELPRIGIEYETHIQSNPNIAGRMICENVGYHHFVSDNRLIRENVHGGKLNELIEDFNEVADHLKGTRFEWMLEANC